MLPDYLPHYTLEDYRHWEGDWELLDGFPLAMSPAPVVRHQYLNTQLSVLLSQALEDCERCLVIQEAEWHLAEDTVLRPDNVVVCYQPKDYLDKRPELVAEILSPSTSRIDEHAKFERYQREGVKYYLLIHPQTLLAKVYELKDGNYRKLNDYSEGRCPLQIDDCQIELDFSALFNAVQKKFG